MCLSGPARATRISPAGRLVDEPFARSERRSPAEGGKLSEAGAGEETRRPGGDIFQAPPGLFGLANLNHHP
jgi:hypothetical protein